MDQFNIKKGKGAYLYNKKSQKYYDLSSNNNILGHSHPVLTHHVKNRLSHHWDLRENTLIHKRYLKSIQTFFPGNYQLRTGSSLLEFFSRFLLYLSENQYQISIPQSRHGEWLHHHLSIPAQKKKKQAHFYDAADGYLFPKQTASNKEHNNDLIIINGYWYPQLEIPYSNWDIMILPQFTSGLFPFINILINSQQKDLVAKSHLLTSTCSQIPSLYLSSSMQMLSLINKYQPQTLPVFQSENIIQKGRLFTFQKIKSDAYLNKSRDLIKEGFYLNTQMPYYNFIPLILEDFQINHLKKLHL